MKFEPLELLDPAALWTLPEARYWALVAALEDGPPGADPDPHPAAFGRAGLLIMTPWCGWCWPGAAGDLARLTWGQVAGAVRAPGGFTTHPRRGLDYPIAAAGPARRALIELADVVHRQDPQRNRAPRPLAPETRLAPAGLTGTRAVTGLLSRTLNAAARACALQPAPTLNQFLAASRWLLTRIHPLWVCHALLDSLPANAPPPDAAPVSLAHLGRGMGPR